MTTDEELNKILDGLKKEGKVKDNSEIEKMLSKKAWHTAIRVEKGGQLSIFYNMPGLGIGVSHINMDISIEEIEKRIKDSSYGLPHQTRDDYRIDGNVIYLRYGTDSIGTLLKE